MGRDSETQLRAVKNRMIKLVVNGIIVFDSVLFLFCFVLMAYYECRQAPQKRSIQCCVYVGTAS